MIKKLILTLALFSNVFGEDTVFPNLPNGFTTPQKIKYDGYNCTEHSVINEQGFTLGFFRIPNPGKPVIAMHHGLLGSSVNWVWLKESLLLAYQLFNAGYDVFLLNSRGTRYSIESTEYDANTPYSGYFGGFKGYWNFSFHEMAVEDTPVVIDKILEMTGKPNLTYVGTSMGTTVLFAMLSELPDYNDKINLGVGLAPVAFINNTKSPLLKQISQVVATWGVNTAVDMVGPGQFLPEGNFITELYRKGCGGVDADYLDSSVCPNIYFYLAGFDMAQYNRSMQKVYVALTPDGASTKTIIHYAQNIRSGGFNRYDYGSFNNNKYYGQSKPPAYNLTNVKVPLRLYHSDNDYLAQPADVNRLYTTLYPNYVNPAKDLKVIKIDYDSWSHLDFLWGIDINTYLNEQVVDEIILTIPPN